jgi:general stress protein YciG
VTLLGQGFEEGKGDFIMAGTKAGAKKAKKTNIERHGVNFFATIGANGGKVKGVKKGFAANPERARAAGKVGGARSRRGKKAA